MNNNYRNNKIFERIYETENLWSKVPSFNSFYPYYYPIDYESSRTASGFIPAHKYESLIKSDYRKQLLEVYPNAINNTKIVQNLSPDSITDLNKLININNIYLSLNPAIMEFSIGHLQKTFDIRVPPKYIFISLGYYLPRCGQHTWAFLCSLNSKFKERDILNQLYMVSLLRTNPMEWRDLNRRMNVVYSREHDLMELWVRKEHVDWYDLSFKEIDHVLNIPYLGILQDQLLNYFITRDLSILTRCIEDVKNNPEAFIIKKNIDLNPTKIKFEWHGESTISTCKSPTHINYKRTNIQGLRILTNACIFEILTASHDKFKSKESYFINQIKDSIIWDDLCDLVMLYVNEDVDELIKHLLLAYICK